MRYAGAGVVIIEIIKNIPYIILGYDKYRKQYIDFGGRYEKHKHKDIKETAQQELFEESCALFKIKKLKFFVNLKFKNTIYKMYFVKLKNIKLDLYFSNLTKLQNNNAPKHFLETQDITKVSLFQVFQCNPVDIYGNQIKIHGRVKDGIQKMFHLIHKIKTQNTKYQINKNSFIHNTISIIN